MNISIFLVSISYFIHDSGLSLSKWGICGSSWIVVLSLRNSYFSKQAKLKLPSPLSVTNTPHQSDTVEPIFIYMPGSNMPQCTVLTRYVGYDRIASATTPAGKVQDQMQCILGKVAYRPRLIQPAVFVAASCRGNPYRPSRDLQGNHGGSRIVHWTVLRYGSTQRDKIWFSIIFFSLFWWVRVSLNKKNIKGRWYPCEWGVNA